MKNLHAAHGQDTHPRAIRQVRGGDGRRPHVTVEGVSYTNEQLAANPELIGSTLEVFINPDDLRTVSLYSPGGLSLGVARAQGRWGDTPHSSRIRREIRDLAAQKQLKLSPDEDPVLQWHDWQARQRMSPDDPLPHAPAGARGQPSPTGNPARTPLTLSAELNRRSASS
jgi:hypothetical protein